MNIITVCLVRIMGQGSIGNLLRGRILTCIEIAEVLRFFALCCSDYSEGLFICTWVGDETSFLQFLKCTMIESVTN